MSDLTRADVAHLASLARIDLSDAELDSLAGERVQLGVGQVDAGEGREVRDVRPGEI